MSRIVPASVVLFKVNQITFVKSTKKQQNEKKYFHNPLLRQEGKPQTKRELMI
jgi:hypothetical protein